MWCRPAKRKRFRSKVDTLLSGGLRLNVARSSPAEVLSITPGLLQLPPADGNTTCPPRSAPSSRRRHHTRMNWGNRLPPRSGPRSLNPVLIHFSVHPVAGCIVSKHSSTSWNKRTSLRQELGADSPRLGSPAPVAQGHSQGVKQFSPHWETERAASHGGNLPAPRDCPHRELAKILTSNYSAAISPCKFFSSPHAWEQSKG